MTLQPCSRKLQTNGLIRMKRSLPKLWRLQTARLGGSAEPAVMNGIRLSLHAQVVEALSRQGKRTDLTSNPLGRKSDGKETAQIIGEQSGDSQTQVRRYIRLTNLVPELLEFVDEGRIKMRPAVELSYLDEDCQRDVVDEIDLNDATPSHDQTIRMRKLFNEGNLTTEAIHAVMSEEKPNQKEKIVLRGDRVRQLIPKNIPVSQSEDFVCKALEHYNKFLRNRAERDSR